MTRQLRPRKNRPSYAALAGLESEEDEVVPSSPVRIEVLNDSETDFSSSHDGGTVEDEDQMDELDDDDGDEQTATSSKKPVARASRKRRNGAANSATRSRKFDIPNPGSKQRGPPLFSPRDRTTRLKERAQLFSEPQTTTTNSFTFSQKLADRVNKAWGYNVGPGPLWELAEDRSWYKEAHEGGASREEHAPRVFEDVLVQPDCEVLEKREAEPYLPRGFTNEGRVNKLPCYFGPHRSQHKREMSLFEAIAPSGSDSTGHVIYAGGPVWAMDWCPIHPTDRVDRSFVQHLALAPFPTHEHKPEIGEKCARPSFACIQLWSLSSTKDASDPEADKGQMKCEMVLCVDSGPAFDLKWCPLASNDLASSSVEIKKLGLLGGTFEDGSFCIYVVPDPASFRTGAIDQNGPIYVRLRPIVRIELDDAACWSFDWANSECIAIGTTNGVIAVYDVGAALKNAKAELVDDLLPTHYVTTHQSAIRSLAWIKIPPCDPSGQPRLDQDPVMILSGGYDGIECLLDLRQGQAVAITRTRDVINSVCFSPFSGCPTTIDHDNSVKEYSVSPVLLGKGHSLCELSGPAWSVHASDYHPQLSIGCADGSCLTINAFKSHRRVSVPPFVHKIFQMDYNRETQEYRMLDRFLPQLTKERPAAATVKKKKAAQKSAVDAPSSASVGIWLQQVAIHRTVWNNGNGFAASSLLAAATASGLCRIDILRGRWSKGQLPYGGIQGIRMEDYDNGVDDDAMDVDGEDEGNGTADAEGEVDEDDE